MFDFFMRRKEIVLDCLTFEPHVYNFAKIEYAKKYYPDWWIKTPSTFNVADAANGMLASRKVNIHSTNKERLTIKHCAAFRNLYNKGIVIPSWFEFEWSISNFADKNTKVRSSDSAFNINSGHSREQYGLFVDENFIHAKISSPWKFSTNKKIYFSWNQPTWNYHQNNLFELCVLPGVLDFYEQNETNINLLTRFKDKDHKIYIPALTPLVILHPLTEQKIIIKNHLVSEKEWRSFNLIGNMIDCTVGENGLVENYYAFRSKREILMNKIGKLGYKKQINGEHDG